MSQVPVTYSTPVGSVAEQWGRIARWLADNTSSAAGVGATAERIAAAQAATGVQWPVELIELLTLVDGFPREQWVDLLPQHELFGIDGVVEEHAMMVEIWGELAEEMGEGCDDVPAAAGVGAGTFIREFVPFAGADGYFLVVDARPGPLHGCVTEFEKVGADDVGPRWHSLSAMLADLADSLHSGAPFDTRYVAVVADGALGWARH